MRASFSMILLLAALAGCGGGTGELLQVTISGAPSGKTVASVNATVVIDTKTESHTFAVGVNSTLSFGVGLPPSAKGKAVGVSVTLLDASNATIGTGSGSTTVQAGTTNLAIAIGGGPSLCADFDSTSLCNGFESGTVGSGWTPNATTGATVTVDKTHVRRGDYALHVATPMAADSNGVYATIAETSKIFDTLYIRAFFYIPSSFDGSSPGALALYEQTASPFDQVTMNVTGGQLGVYDNIDASQQSSGGSIPADTWTCVEWEVAKGSPGATAIWVNDKLTTPALNPIQTDPMPALTQVAVGLVTAQMGTPARELWIDEVVVAGSQTGCTK